MTGLVTWRILAVLRALVTSRGPANDCTVFLAFSGVSGWVASGRLAPRSGAVKKASASEAAHRFHVSV